MTVRELIARLQTMYQDAPVYIARDRSWPWEHQVFAVVERKKLECGDRDEHWDPFDVLLLEGDRIGFGPEFAWADAGKAAESHGG